MVVCEPGQCGKRQHRSSLGGGPGVGILVAGAVPREEEPLVGDHVDQVVPAGLGERCSGHDLPAARQQRLKDLALKREAEQKAAIAGQASEAMNEKSGDELVNVGYAYVTMGQVDKGVGLIEQGIAKGSLKRPADAKLRLGMAQLQSAKSKAKAAQTLRGVQGNDGVADIARLWLVPGLGNGG